MIIKDPSYWSVSYVNYMLNTLKRLRVAYIPKEQSIFIDTDSPMFLIMIDEEELVYLVYGDHYSPRYKFPSIGEVDD